MSWVINVWVWVIVSTASSSKLWWILILIRSMLRIPISLTESTTLPESSLKENLFSCTYKSVKSSLFLTNQLRISC